MNHCKKKNNICAPDCYLFKEDFNLEIWKTLEDTLIPQGERPSVSASHGHGVDAVKVGM
jgi:hypothetical protein